MYRCSSEKIGLILGIASYRGISYYTTIIPYSRWTHLNAEILTIKWFYHTIYRMHY